MGVEVSGIFHSHS